MPSGWLTASRTGKQVDFGVHNESLQTQAASLLQPLANPFVWYADMHNDNAARVFRCRRGKESTFHTHKRDRPIRLDAVVSTGSVITIHSRRYVDRQNMCR